MPLSTWARLGPYLHSNTIPQIPLFTSIHLQVAALAGAMALGEAITVRAAIGVMCVISGVYMGASSPVNQGTDGNGEGTSRHPTLVSFHLGCLA